MELMVLIIVLIILAGMGAWYLISRKRANRITRPRVYNQKCPNCGSTEIYSAGYSDRKECGKCGKIF
jgi:ribosomal protein S27AE